MNSEFIKRLLSDATAEMPPPDLDTEAVAAIKTRYHTIILFRVLVDRDEAAWREGDYWEEYWAQSCSEPAYSHVPDPDEWFAEYDPALRCDPQTGEYLDPEAAAAALR